MLFDSPKTTQKDLSLAGFPSTFIGDLTALLTKDLRKQIITKTILPQLKRGLRKLDSFVFGDNTARSVSVCLILVFAN